MTSNSLKALNTLHSMACVEAGYKKEYITYAKEIEHNEYVKKQFDILSKALERLEQLELNLDGEKYQLSSENESLKNRVEDLEICYKVLLKENQELKDKLSGIEFWQERYIERNEELKKAIEILQRFNFKLDHLPNGEYCIYIYHSGIEIRIILTKEEYGLLKEVLEE